MIYKDLDGTQKDIFSLGTGNNRIDIRNNNGIIEARQFNGDWFPVGRNLYDDTSEPNGFIGDVSSVSLTYSNPTFTISGNRSFWSDGNRITKTTDDTLSITERDQPVYIYYDASGVLQKSTTWSNDYLTKYAIVSIAYISSDDDTVVFLLFELHNCTMDGATHSYLHNHLGMVYISGLTPGNIVADGDGSSDTHAQLSLTDGVCYDEDLIVTPTNAAVPSATFEQKLSTVAYLPVYYRTGASGVWRKDTATAFPVKRFGTDLLAYNQFTGGAWQQTEVGNNNFVLTHIIATNNTNEPIIVVQGQSEYSTKTEAQEAAYTEMQLISFDELPLPEINPIATLIFSTKSTYSNAVKAIIVSTDEGADYVDFRTSSTRGESNLSNHAMLGNLDYYNSNHTGFQRQTTISASSPTANDDESNTSGNGIFQVADLWYDTTGTTMYICTDATATAAVWAGI